MSPTLQTLSHSLDQWQAVYISSIVIALLATFAIVVFAFHVQERKIALKISNYIYVLFSLLAVVSTIVIVFKTKAADAEKDRIAAKAARDADSKIAQDQKDTAAIKRQSAEAIERANVAERQAAEENAKAAKTLVTAEIARKEAEGFQLQIAQANERASQAEQQAAESNRLAQQESFQTVQLEARLADRVVTPDQKRRITEAFGPMKGQTIDLAIMGDSPEISRITEAIVEALHSAGVLLNYFHPLTGGGAEGVVVGIRPDAPSEDKQAGSQMIAILRETLGGGVGQLDFDKLTVSGTGTIGSDKGTTPVGKSPFRLQIAPK